MKKLSEVKEGDILIADDGFYCIPEGSEVIVQKCKQGLYVPCSQGKHFLIGQTNPDGTLVGFAAKEKANEMQS